MSKPRICTVCNWHAASPGTQPGICLACSLEETKAKYQEERKSRPWSCAPYVTDSNTVNRKTKAQG